jgi:hypothetical protein
MGLTNEQRVRIALIDLKRIERERQLLKGHFSLVAKRHAVKVRDLQKAYQTA